MSSPTSDHRIGVRRSLFDALRERMPEVRPVLASKATLVITSHLVEDLVARSPGRSVLVSGFQHSRHWAVERNRYLDMAADHEIIAVFAGREPPATWDVDHLGIRLRDGDPLSQEWFVLALGPQLAVTLCGLDSQPDVAGAPVTEEGDRLFETIWSFDAQVARTACEVVLEAVEEAAPERAAAARAQVAALGRIEPDVQDVARGADNVVAGLLERMERLRLSEKRAERAASQAKTDFLSRMSHELRTPLNVILGFGQVLETRVDEPSREAVDHILGAGRHLLELIDEVLDISRIESGKLELSLEELDLARPLQECVELIAPLARGRAIEVSFDTPDELRVLADRRRLAQIFLNLLSNAVKYNAEGGTIVVDAERTAEGSVAVRVRDTGAGIAPEDIGRLFVPFERLAAAGDTQGTGLGLALSQRMAEAMGGRIEVDSRRGRGTVFTLILPPLPAAAAATEAPPALPDRPDGVREVLYIEDNPANLRLVEWILDAREDLAVVGASRGAQGLAVARERRPAVVLLDLHLPDADGRELLASLREDSRTADIPVVVVTADRMSRPERLVDAGAAAVLTKPIDVQELLATLGGLLD